MFGLENLSLADALSGVGNMLMLPSDSGAPFPPLTSAGVGGNWQEELFLVLSSWGYVSLLCRLA